MISEIICALCAFVYLLFNLLEFQQPDRSLSIVSWSNKFGKASYINDFDSSGPWGITIASSVDGRTWPMKKNEFSELLSNLLMFGSVSLAFMPLILGDRLLLVMSGLMQEGSVMIDRVHNYISWLIS